MPQGQPQDRSGGLGKPALQRPPQTLPQLKGHLWLPSGPCQAGSSGHPQGQVLTLGKCFMTHITTGCRDGIFTREKLFSSRSSSFLYLERLQ